MADPKDPLPGKGSPEFAAWKKASDEAAVLQAFGLMFAPDKGAVASALSIAKLTDVQLSHAVIPQAIITAGEGKDFQVPFDRLYRNQRMPEIKKPTTVNQFVLENSPKYVNPAEMPWVHGHSMAAKARASLIALTGTEKPIILMNRDAKGNELDQTIVDIREQKGELAYTVAPDLAQGHLRERYFSKGLNVISISMMGNHKDIIDRKGRIETEKKLDEHYGPNTIYVASAGNKFNYENPRRETSLLEDPCMRHIAMRYTPRTLLVGAANSTECLMQDGKTLPTFSMENYSMVAPDIVMVANPENARYMEFIPGQGMRMMPQRGTSPAAAQAASAVAHLMRRFAAAKENTSAVLSKEEVLLAIRQTAQPLHLEMEPQRSYRMEEAVPTETTRDISMSWITTRKLGDHYVSQEAGNGIFDPRAAWALLEKQETAVKTKAEKMLPRVDLSAELTASEKTVNASQYPLLAGVPPIPLYRYTLNVKDNLISDQIIIDAQSHHFGKHLGDVDLAKRPRMFLLSPQNDMVEIRPSTGFTQGRDPDGRMFDIPNSYMMARAPGMHNLPMKGEWTLLSTKELGSATLNFPQAMQPEHVAARIVPDAKQRERDLYRWSNFSHFSPQALETALLKADAPMLKHDLSTLGVPPHFFDMHLAMAVEKGEKELAQKLLTARYGDFKEKDALKKAVEAGQSKEVLDILMPPATRFEAFRKLAGTASKSEIIFLAENGFATLKETGMPKDVNPSTALIELVKQRGLKAEPALVQLFIDKKADVMQQDKDGRSVLHYSRNTDVLSLLTDSIRKDPATFPLFEAKDKDGKKYMDFLFPPPPTAPAPATPPPATPAPSGGMGFAPADLNSLQVPTAGKSQTDGIIKK